MDSIASSALLQVFSDDSGDSAPRLPISSSKLLRHLILHGANLKLGDRADFDAALRALAQSWEYGTMTLREEDATPGSSQSAGEAVVTSVTLTGVKKRKRHAEEEVDCKLQNTEAATIILEETRTDSRFTTSFSQAERVPVQSCECRAGRSL